MGTEIALLVGLYFLPTIAAGVRRRPNPAPLIIVNALLGWTFVGWVVALAMAFSNPAPVVVRSAPRFNVYTGEPISPRTQEGPPPRGGGIRSGSA